MSGLDDMEAIMIARLDADIEQAEMDAGGEAYYAAKRSGRCPHGATQHLRCRDCGRQFRSEDEWFYAMDEAVAA